MSATTQAQTTGRAEPGIPVIPAINWLGLKTLYLKEVRRFFKVQLQTIWAPAINTLLFLAIFTVGFGRGGRVVMGVPFADFLGPGLIVMGMMQAAFANSSSSLQISKVQGTLIDVLMPPLSSGELLVSYVAGAVTRSWMVGTLTFVAMLFWPDMHIAPRHVAAILFFGTAGSAMLALLGVLTGIWAEKFDQGAMVTNFVVQPLTLLSGTFYTLDALRQPWNMLGHLNPFFFAIDGFRYGFLGTTNAPLWVGVAVLSALVLILWLVCYRLLCSGWKLKA